MARVLISVRDPLNLAGKDGVKPLLLGSYVSVKIDGGQLTDVYELPRSAFRDNTSIWVLTADGTLDIRPVKPIWRDNDTIVLTSGIAADETIVTSNLSAPMQGMRLRSASASAPRGATARTESENNKELGQNDGVNSNG